jgi:hypothetical protein
MSNRRRLGRNKGDEGSAIPQIKQAPCSSSLPVIAEPAQGTRAVLVSQSPDPDFVFFRGMGNGVQYACGSCGKILIQGVSLNQIVSIVLQCPACKAFNDTAQASYSLGNAAARQDPSFSTDKSEDSKIGTDGSNQLSDTAPTNGDAMGIHEEEHVPAPVPGDPNNIDLSKMPNPQNRPNSDRPGSYDLVFRRPKAEVIPGGEVEVAIYITGYGSISDAKLYFVPPTDFLDPDRCYVDFDLNRRADGLVHFGVTRQGIAGESFTLDLSSGGLKPPAWHGPSLFFDKGLGIATESATRDIESGKLEPPVKFTMRVKEKVARGDHDLNFALTYFNGREWAIAYRTASLHVPTFYERHAGWAWSIGTAIAVIAAAATVLGLIKALG